MKTQFGNHLRLLRQQNHLTQRQLGHRLGVSDKAISRWEAGDTAPDLEALSTIAAVFGISVDRLLGVCPLPNALHTTAVTPPYAPPPLDYLTGGRITTSGIQEEVAEQLQLGGEFNSNEWDALTAETLFGDRNYYHFLDRDQRRDMLFMLNIGWNAPFWSASNHPPLDKIDADEEKFGALGDTPLQRLKGLVERTREYGYGGLGLSLWLSDESLCDKAAEQEWIEQARRCQRAGVRLVGIFYSQEYSEAFWQMLTRVFRRYAPDVWLELSMPWQRYLARADAEAIEQRRRQLATLLPLCDAVNIVDNFDPYATASALRNADLALDCGAVPAEGRWGRLYCCQQSHVGAVLGLTVSIARDSKEGEAALYWQRLSPPFGVGEAPYIHSETYLEDSHYFYRNVERPQLEGETMRQTAPAVMARGCPLPQVTVPEGITPYIAASRNPHTGAYALGSFQRNVPPNYSLWGLADVTLQVDSLSAPVGLFGLFRTVRLTYPAPLPATLQVTVQDPAGHIAPMDVTDRVSVQGDTLSLDGALLGNWGKIGWDKDYTEAPSLVLRLKI
ncbi:MAG: helix-turn-helix transcriptional regulator [Ruminococcaceae bacterium]|nr:helix-turn-helix transcriptional regulator [Oscillospiraceae bacterium]